MNDTIKRIDATEEEIQAFLKSLSLFLKRNLTPIAKKLSAGDIRALDAATTLGQLETALRQAGLQNEYAVLRRTYAGELDHIARTLSAASGIDAPSIFTGADKQTVEALINFQFESFDDVVISNTAQFRESFMRSVLIGEKFDPYAGIDILTDQVERGMYTRVNTALQGFSRTVAVSKGIQLGLELFHYVGPDDKVTRRFCHAVLTNREPPVYTLAEVRGMKNGQGLDVFTYGGGYNCRHRWNPITEERAKALGWASQ